MLLVAWKETTMRFAFVSWALIIVIGLAAAIGVGLAGR